MLARLSQANAATLIVRMIIPQQESRKLLLRFGKIVWITIKFKNRIFLSIIMNITFFLDERAF